VPFLKSLRLGGLLSFPPDSPAVPLTPLNVLIGPNASGKSNFLEAIELLHATPTAFASAIRDGGGAREWLWKGAGAAGAPEAEIEARIVGPKGGPDLRYRLRFAAAGLQTEVTDEAIEKFDPDLPHYRDVYFYYRFQGGNPALNTAGQHRTLQRTSLAADESVLSQVKDPELYPEVTWVGREFGRVQTFREWTFGRYAPLRQPQKADLPSASLLPDSGNLWLILSRLDNSSESARFNHLLHRFLPRFNRLATPVEAGAVQFYLHEAGLGRPIPSTRLSDGTIRFVALLALLLTSAPPPVICIEEPELGLHPDALSILAEVMVEASARTQLIVTTHSDAFVSALTDQTESVLVCDYLGGTSMRRLESEKLASWLEKYRLGEIWRMGELAGNP